MSRCETQGNGRNNTLPDAPSSVFVSPTLRTSDVSNTAYGGGYSDGIQPTSSSSYSASALVEKLSSEVVSIRVTCNAVKQECSKLRLEVASLALIQSQMREEFKHTLLSIDNRLASLQTDQKVVKAAVDLSLAPRTAGIFVL